MSTTVTVLIVYLGILAALAIWSRRETHTLSGFYLAGKKLPFWVVAFSSEEQPGIELSGSRVLPPVLWQLNPAHPVALQTQRVGERQQRLGRGPLNQLSHCLHSQSKRRLASLICSNSLRSSSPVSFSG